MMVPPLTVPSVKPAPLEPLMAPETVRLVVGALVFLSVIDPSKVQGPEQTVSPFTKLIVLPLPREKALARVTMSFGSLVHQKDVPPEVLVIAPAPKELLLL